MAWWKHDDDNDDDDDDDDDDHDDRDDDHDDDRDGQPQFSPAVWQHTVKEVDH